MVQAIRGEVKIDIRMGIPDAESMATPVELFLEAFSLVRQHDSLPLTLRAAQAAREIQDAVRTCATERNLVELVAASLSRLVDLYIKEEDTIASQRRLPERTDGAYSVDLRVEGDVLRTPVLLLECKSDIGDGGGAMYQVVASYCKRLTEARAGGPYCHQPCILVAMSGPVMQIFGAITEGSSIVHVSLLSCIHFLVEDTVAFDSRVQQLVALRNGVHGIIQHLRTATVETHSGFLRPFPVPGLCYKARREGARVYDGEYTHAADDGQGEASPHTVAAVVKFVARAGCGAVQHSLAAAGLAPRVLANVQVWATAWHAIVMEEVRNACTLGDYLLGTSMDHAIATSLYEQLDAMLVVLHRAGHVHGDISVANVIVVQAIGDKQPRLLLVDFEWAGAAGQVQYPGLKEDIGGTTIETEHDAQAVACIRGQIEAALAASSVVSRLDGLSCD
jgi:hypothetical protein